MSDESTGPDGLDELLDEVFDLRARGQYDEAVERLDALLERDTENSNAYALRGSIEHDAGRYEAAVEDYERAIDVDPENYRFYYSCGLSKLSLGDPDGAVAEFGRAIERAPEELHVWQVRAETRLRTGELAKAAEDAERASELSDTPGERAVSLLLALVAGIANDDAADWQEAEFRAICQEEPDPQWDLEQLDDWLADADLTDEQESSIQELIDLLRAHV